MATYEFVCLGCEHLFEERRPIGSGAVATELTCPSCGSERIRRRFSFAAPIGATDIAPSSSGGGCGCGNCTCGAG